MWPAVTLAWAGCVLGCAPEDPFLPSPSRDDAVPRWALSFRADGALAVFDVASGEVAHATPLPAGGGRRDVALDACGGRVWVLISDDEGASGEVLVCPLDRAQAPPGLGACVHEVWVDGVAALWATERGVVVFEDGYGPRWKLLRDDGVPSKGAPAPRPASVHASGADAFEVLTYGEDGVRLEWRRASVTGGVVDVTSVMDLGLSPGGDPPSARMAVLPSGEGLVVDVALGDVVLRPFVGSTVGEEKRVEAVPAIERVEAVALSGDLLSVLTPAGLLVTDAAGEGSAAVVPLPGTVRREMTFFSRDCERRRGPVARRHGWRGGRGGGAAGRGRRAGLARWRVHGKRASRTDPCAKRVSVTRCFWTIGERRRAGGWDKMETWYPRAYWLAWGSGCSCSRVAAGSRRHRRGGPRRAAREAPGGLAARAGPGA